MEHVGNESFALEKPGDATTFGALSAKLLKEASNVATVCALYCSNCRGYHGARSTRLNITIWQKSAIFVIVILRWR